MGYKPIRPVSPREWGNYFSFFHEASLPWFRLRPYIFPTKICICRLVGVGFWKGNYSSPNFFSSFPDLRLRILEVSKKEACFIYQVMPLSMSVKAIILKLWITVSFISTGKLNPKGNVIVGSRSGRKRPSDLGLRLAQEWKNQNQLPELIYKRWGRKDCPETATLVYHGKEKIRLSTNSLGWVIAQVNFFRVNICLQNWAA